MTENRIRVKPVQPSRPLKVKTSTGPTNIKISNIDYWYRLAKEWAIKMTDKVENIDYSAKQWAAWSKVWAEGTDEEVVARGGEHSAKQWAILAKQEVEQKIAEHNIDEDAHPYILELVQQEIENRLIAEGLLSDAIVAEATARQTADTTLQTNITNETTARQTADTTLQTNITNEATARANADTALQSSITAIETTIDTYGDVVTHDADEFATAAQGAKADSALQTTDIINNTTTTSTDKALSANMGKELQDQVNNLKARGRFLSLWDCSTGLAETTPTTLPYSYKTGDYFIIGTVASSGNTNYKPNGSQYTAEASTTVETTTVNVDDVYYYDGSTWHLQVNTRIATSFAAITGDPYDNANLSNALNAKQDELTAGSNIQISDQNVISATDTTYTAGVGLDLSANAFDIKQIKTLAQSVTIVGSPTNINNNYFTNFTGSDLIQPNLGDGLTINAADTTEFVLKIKTPPTYVNNACYFADYQYNVGGTDQTSWCRIAFGNPMTSLCFTPIGFSWSGGWGPEASGTYKANTIYWLKATKTIETVGDTTTYYFKVFTSEDGQTWTQTNSRVTTTEPTSMTYSTINLGAAATTEATKSLLNGTVYLEDCYIKVNDTYVWNPSSNTTKAPALATNDKYGVVRPDNVNVTINDGIISAKDTTYSSSSGLKLSSNNEFAIAQKDVGTPNYYEAVGTVEESAPYAFTYLNASNYIKILTKGIEIKPEDTFEFVYGFKVPMSMSSSGMYGTFQKNDSSPDVLTLTKSGSSMLSNYRLIIPTLGLGTSALISISSLFYDEEVYIKVVGNADTAAIYYSIDNGTWRTAIPSIARNATTDVINNISLGCGNLTTMTFLFKEAYLKINGEYVWHPTNNVYQAVAKATTDLYGLVKPDGTTVTVNDGVISATGESYTAGQNIQISDQNVISATDTTYTAGTNVTISDQNVISATDTTYTAGANITIENNVISAEAGATLSAGKGINIEDDTVSIQQSDFGIKTTTIVGNLTESQGVYSGFSQQDYILLKGGSFKPFSPTDNWEFQIKFRTPSSFSQITSLRYVMSARTPMTIYHNYARSFYIGGASYPNNPTFNSSTDYWVRIRNAVNDAGTAVGIYMKYSTNGTTWSEEIRTMQYSINDSGAQAILVEDIKLGSSTSANSEFQGSIDLNSSYLKVNGKYYWQPFVDNYKETAKASEVDYGLVKVDGTSIEANNGVISFIDYEASTVTNADRKLDVIQDNIGVDKVGTIENQGSIYLFNSTSGYLKIPGTLSTLSTYDSEIPASITLTFKIYVNSIGHDQYVFCANKTPNTTNANNSFYIKINADGTMAGHFCTNTSGDFAEASFPNVTANSTIWLKLELMSGTFIRTATSIDGSTWSYYGNASVSDYTVQLFNEMYLGKSNATGSDYFDGSIDLANASILHDFYTKILNFHKPALATNSLYGLVKPDGSTVTIQDGVITAIDTTYTAGQNIQISNQNVISAVIPTATTTDLGLVKPDGTTITVNNGVITANYTALTNAEIDTIWSSNS